jgi:hypothetical protein
MSTIALGIAAGVAQGSVQAREISRALHRQATEAPSDARRIRDRLNAHLDGLDEGDDANTLSELHVDDQVPQRGQDHHDKHEREEKPAAPPDEEPAIADQAKDASEDHPPKDAPGDRLYRHLDVTG